MVALYPRPMSLAPLDGTPVRLFGFAGWVIASFWSEQRCREAFGAGDYRAGWYLLGDDVIEVDAPIGWEPLLHACARSENETVSIMPQPVLP
jgi:hypothetical protein